MRRWFHTKADERFERRFRLSIEQDGDPPAGGGGAVTLDQVKEAAKAAANEAINAFAASRKKDEAKLNQTLQTITASLEALKPTTPEPEPKPGDPPKSSDPQQNAVLLALQKKVDQLTKSQEESEKRRLDAENRADKSDRESKIRAVFGEYKFVNQKALDAAFREISAQITRAEDGSLVAGDLPFDTFIKEQLGNPEYAFYLAPVDKTGAGARGGAPRGSRTVQLEDIKPDASPEAKQAIYAELQRVAAGQ